MALIIADRVLETSTTTGTGAYTLAGAVTGYRTASAAGAVNASTLYYYAEDVDANGVPNGGWETGLGTWGTGGTLTRTSVHASSNANAAVSWAAGTRRIALGFTVKGMNALGVNSGGGVSQAVTGAGAMALGGSYASGQDSFAAAIGDNTNAYGAQGTNSVAIGFHAKATGPSSLALGGNAGSTLTASATYGCAIGLNSAGDSSQAVSGSAAMALGGSYASGSNSFAAAIANNTSSYGAQGSGAIAMGALSKATATNSMALLGAVITTTKRFGIGGAGFCQAVSESANSAMGTATLVGGVATVSNTLVTATSRIFLTSQVDGGTVGFLRVSARTAGTSFVITSSSVLDTSTVSYIFYEPQ